MKFSRKTTQLLKEGGIGVLPTDTIYGLACQALNAKAVERVYEVRKRRPDKPCIILIADVADLEKFGISLDQQSESLIGQLWPGPVSIVLPCGKAELVYLHRRTNTLAFRLPENEELRGLLRETGPLIAPSANPEGLAPAHTIGQAKVYFEDQVDFFEDAGELIGAPSTVVELKNGKVVVLRQGAKQIPSTLV